MTEVVVSVVEIGDVKSKATLGVSIAGKRIKIERNCFLP